MSLWGAIDVQPAGLSEVPVAAAKFDYDAAKTQDRRKTATVRSQSEDRILDTGKRAQVQANARDISRNFSIAAWAIRRHLDYVSTFQFHARTKDEGLNTAIEQLLERWSKAPVCDVAGRHCLRRLIRLTELGAIKDGDTGLLKLRSGQLQGIESDRIRNPAGDITRDANWVHGVKTNAAGRAMAYGLYSRSNFGSFQFDRTVPAGNLCLHGYFDRFDQVRGISPIVTALNPLRDVYENFNYALAKAKVQQLFAMVFYREALDSAGDLENQGGDGERSGYEVNFGKGPVLLDLDPGDKAEFLESQHPSSQFQDFTQLVVMVALKALDIPYSFYDESHTNFFGSRGAWLHYERSCEDKRENLVELLNRLTVWRIALWILDGELQLPSGWTMGDLAWEWVPMGMPWWDPVKEINGDLAAVSAAFDNPQRICKERGRGDFYNNVREIKKAIDFARENGVQLKFDPILQPIEVVEREDS